MNRRHRRAPLVATASALAAATLVVALPADAGPSPAPVAAPAALAAITDDRSHEMPRTRHNEAVGDFLGRGYDLRAVVENGNLNVRDSAVRGGGLVSSVPTDLTPADTDFVRGAWFGDWAQTAEDHDLGAVALAWATDGLFMAGRTADGDSYLYKTAADGSCANQGCASWVTRLPAYDQFGESSLYVSASAIAVGTIGTRPVLAVGMTTTSVRQVFSRCTPDGCTYMAGGVVIVDRTDGSVVATWRNPFPEETNGRASVITALDWDDTGSGLLAVGVLTDAGLYPGSNLVSLYSTRVSATGGFSNDTSWRGPPPTFGGPFPLSVVVGHRGDDPVVAAGLSDGTVKLWDPAVTSATLLSEFAGTADSPIDALIFTDRTDGTVGVPDLVAVSSKGNTARVLRYSGATTLAPRPVAPQGGTSTDVGGIRDWYPGYKTGVVSFTNRNRTPLNTIDPEIQLDFATRPNAAYGCWFGQGFDGLPALPTTSVVLDGSSSPSFTVATQTAGEGGDCAATDFTGQWAAYVVAAPVGRPADRTIAKLVWSRSGELTVQQVGGSLTLTPTRNVSDLAHPLGSWTIDVVSPASPKVPSGGMRLTAKRLDPAGTDRPVYRFDLAASTWAMPVSTPGRIQTVLPPITVQAITTTGSTIDLGLLVPQGAPTRATSGSVTLSPVSFYWQNPAVGAQVKELYVEVNSGGSFVGSNFITLADVPAPPASTTVGALVVCPATGSSTCNADADPVANGLDQAPLRIQARDVIDQNVVLPLTDPAYGQIYYRDQDDNLLTGLIPADGSPYVRVSPYAGAYPNDGSSGSTTRPPVNGPVGGRFGYLSTTSTVEQEITAHLGGSSEVSDPITVQATTLTPQVQAGGQAGSGFYVTGCGGDYTNSSVCRIAASDGTSPGLFLTSDPDSGDLRIGLQLKTQAQTSLTSLPLQQVAGQAEHTVAANPLLVNNGEVHLTTTSGFQPADTVDTWLVTHGSQIPIRALRVGGGN